MPYYLDYTRTDMTPMTNILDSEGDTNLTQHRQKWHAQQSHKSQSLLIRDENVFLHQSLSSPCLDVIEHCDGVYFYDVNGRRYLDFHGNNVHQLGYSHPNVTGAINEQIKQLSFCVRRYTNQVSIELAEKLVEISPANLTRVLFAPGGASAISMAMKLARIYTGKHKTISLWDSFHGANLDTISIGGEAVFRQNIGPLLPGCEHAPPPAPNQCVFKCGKTCSTQCADYIEYMLEKEGDIACVIAETIRSTPYIPPKHYWQKVRAACDKHGALLILDEVPHCLGRSGKMFTVEHYDIEPDMLVIGKGLGGGIMPFAALLASETLNCASHTALGHYTHEKSPVSAAAALATINTIEDENLLAHCNVMGEYFEQQLLALKAQFSVIHDVRGLGLFWGVELRFDDGTKAKDLAERIMYRALSLGLNFKVTMGNVLTLTPPIIIQREQLDDAILILQECLSLEIDTKKER
ncbi:MAG: 4-aminobutyrate aminotransferase [Oceanicoccus sp.]|jgi:4-aminobutyrate aminotransferase